MKTIGIDFGTSNSAVAVWDTRTGKLKASDYEGTLLYFEGIRNHPPFIGNAAIREYVGQGMSGRFFKSLKSLLSFSLFKYTNIAGQKYSAEELVAIILKYYYEKGLAMTRGKPDRVIIGRPVHFSASIEKDELAQDRLAKAAKIAGIENPLFQYEPIAAALTYERELEKEEIVLVCDLGGGTSDFTLMRLNPSKRKKGDRKEDILGTAGIKIGGDDFDSAIAWHKIIPQLGLGLEYDSTGKGKMLPISPANYREFCKWERHSLLNTPMKLKELRDYLRWTHGNPQLQAFIDIIQGNLGYSLFQSIERAKITLSEQDTASIHFDKGEVHLQAPITLAEFEFYLADHLTALADCIDALFSRINLTSDQVDSVFLTGGSSLVRPVRSLFEQKFGKEKIKENDSFTSVVKGLALSSEGVD